MRVRSSLPEDPGINEESLQSSRHQHEHILLQAKGADAFRKIYSWCQDQIGNRDGANRFAGITAIPCPKHRNFLGIFKKLIIFLPGRGEFSRISDSGGPTSAEIGAAILGYRSRNGLYMSYPPFSSRFEFARPSKPARRSARFVATINCKKLSSKVGCKSLSAALWKRRQAPKLCWKSGSQNVLRKKLLSVRLPVEYNHCSEFAYYQALSAI